MGFGDFVSPSLARIAPAAAAEADFGVMDDAGVTLTPVFLACVFLDVYFLTYEGEMDCKVEPAALAYLFKLWFP